jgi:hypothetical protein
MAPDELTSQDELRKTEIRTSLIPHAGRGVFAKRVLKQGETIERAESLKIEKSSTSLTKFQFQDPRDANATLLVLGSGSLYNHAGTLANTGYRPAQDSDTVMEFYALRDVTSGDELTIDYGYEVDSATNFLAKSKGKSGGPMLPPTTGPMSGPMAKVAKMAKTCDDYYLPLNGPPVRATLCSNYAPPGVVAQSPFCLSRSSSNIQDLPRFSYSVPTC